MNHQSTPKSSNTDVHELRYRISQLEHLVVQSSFNSSNLNSTSLPSNSTALHSPQGLVARGNELEGLLAASEFENETMRQQFELLTVDKNRQEVKLLEQVFQKDMEVKDSEHRYKLLQVKYQKSQSKLDNIQDYINGLPSQNELDEARSIISQLQEDNQLLEGKVLRLTDNLDMLQRERIALEHAKIQVELRLEELKPLEEAQSAISAEIDSSNPDALDKNTLVESLTLQKAQLIRSSKLISSLREKLLQLELEKVEAVVKISNLGSDVESLQEQQLATELKMDTVVERSKNLDRQNTDLQSENTELRNQIEQRDSSLQQKDEHINSLTKLVTEIDLCVNEVDKLVDLGRSIAIGEEPSVSTLLGLSDDLETHIRNLNGEKLSAADTLEYSPNDVEWTLDKLCKVRNIRKHLNVLRDVANDLYTDMLGGKVEGCKVQ